MTGLTGGYHLKIQNVGSRTMGIFFSENVAPCTSFSEDLHFETSFSWFVYKMSVVALYSFQARPDFRCVFRMTSHRGVLTPKPVECPFSAK